MAGPWETGQWAAAAADSGRRGVGSGWLTSRVAVSLVVVEVLVEVLMSVGARRSQIVTQLTERAGGSR
jgi:hypothetical protein